LLERGDDPGSNILNSYHDRGNFEEEDSSFISGDISSSNQARFGLQYHVNSTTAIKMIWIDHQGVELGMKLTW